jgi:hypothetical protein
MGVAATIAKAPTGLLGHFEMVKMSANRLLAAVFTVLLPPSSGWKTARFIGFRRVYLYDSEGVADNCE